MDRRLIDTLETLYAFARHRYGRRPADRRALRAWQHRRVVGHLRWVLPRSPFYRRRFEQEGLGLASWRALPPLTKSELMEHFSSLNTAGVERDRALDLALRADRSRDFTPKLDGLTVGLSSGTSGHRGLFLASQSENNQWSGAALAKMLPGSPLGVHRIALLHRANSHLYQGLGDGRLQLRYFDLLQPVATLVEALERYEPTLLIGPPGALRLLAERRLAGHFRLARPPARVVSVAEVLEPPDRRVIERGLERRVDVAYVATEGFIASSCERGVLHLNEDLVAVDKEWVDERARSFVPVVTDFRRRVVPIIRYRLDDVLTLREGRCECGSVFAALESVQGRCDDVFHLGGVLVLPDFLRRALLQASDHIRAYELVQRGPTSIDVGLALTAQGAGERARVCDQVEREIQRVLQALGAPRARLLVTTDLSVPEGPSATKQRRVRRELAHGDDAQHGVL